MPQLVTLETYFPNGFVPPADLLANATALLVAVNGLLQELAVTGVAVTSGYRSPDHNARIGGAPNSKHCQALAVDLLDPQGSLGKALNVDSSPLRRRSMAMEDPAYTVRLNGTHWVHLQLGLPKSGKTVFVPYAGPIILK